MDHKKKTHRNYCMKGAKHEAKTPAAAPVGKALDYLRGGANNDNCAMNL